MWAVTCVEMGLLRQFARGKVLGTWLFQRTRLLLVLTSSYIIRPGFSRPLTSIVLQDFLLVIEYSHHLNAYLF